MSKSSIQMKSFGKVGVLLCALACFSGNVAAQVSQRAEIFSKKVISDFDNTTFCVAYLSDNKMWAFRDVSIADINEIDKVVFNPTGSSLAILSGKKDISIYSFRERNTKLFELKDKRKGLKDRVNLPFVLPGEKGAKLMKAASKGDIVSLAMCYAPDARHFVASNSLGEIIIYDTKEYLPQSYIQSELPATLLAMSSNNYFIAAASSKKLDIWNFQTKALRKSINMDGNVLGFDFSVDAAYLAVVTDNQVLTVFDTKTWEKVHTFDQLGGNLAGAVFLVELSDLNGRTVLQDSGLNVFSVVEI